MALSPAEQQYLRKHRSSPQYWTEERMQARRDSVRKSREKRQTFLREYKRDSGCRVCGETDPVVLEFDHLDRSKKTRNGTSYPRSTVWTRMGMGAIKKELENCQVLCANCHKRKTYRDRDHLPALTGNAATPGKE